MKTEDELADLRNQLTRAREEVTGATNHATYWLKRCEKAEAQLTQSLATGERMRDAAKKLVEAWEGDSPDLNLVAERMCDLDEALAASPHAAPAAGHEDTKLLDWWEREHCGMTAYDDNGTKRWRVGGGGHPRGFKPTLRAAIRAAMAAAPLPPTKAGEE